jgi:hypothetical protein
MERDPLTAVLIKKRPDLAKPYLRLSGLSYNARYHAKYDQARVNEALLLLTKCRAQIAEVTKP